MKSKEPFYSSEDEAQDRELLQLENPEASEEDILGLLEERRLPPSYHSLFSDNIATEDVTAVWSSVAINPLSVDKVLEVSQNLPLPILHYLQGYLTVREVAQLMNTSKSSAHRQIHTYINKIRSILP